MAGGLRASGPKADLALVVADGDAAAAGVFTTNIVCAAPVTFCRNVLAKRETVRAVCAHLHPSPPPTQTEGVVSRHSRKQLDGDVADYATAMKYTAKFVQSLVTGVFSSNMTTWQCPLHTEQLTQSRPSTWTFSA